MSWIDKITKIEAVIARASSEGERQAALLAKERILKKQDQSPIEYTITHHNMWKRKLFMALCYKYDLTPYRYKRQKYTTTVVQVSPALMTECLWPEYQKYAVMLEQLVDDILDGLLMKIQQKEEQEVVLNEKPLELS